MRKIDVVDIESLEEYYKTTRKIKFRDDYEVKSLDDVYAGMFPTLPHTWYGSENTYYSRGAHHCNNNRYRSIEDFIKVSKRYFPEKTVKEIFQFLKEKEDSYLEQGYMQYLGYCPNIRKYNFRGLQHKGYASKGIGTYELGDLFENLSDLKVSDILT